MGAARRCTNSVMPAAPRHRLNRDLSGSFGSKKYAFEELAAEMNAAFCCASLGILPTVRHTDYTGSRRCAKTTRHLRAASCVSHNVSLVKEVRRAHAKPHLHLVRTSHTPP